MRIGAGERCDAALVASNAAHRQQRSELQAVVRALAGTRPCGRALAVELPSISSWSSRARSNIGSRCHRRDRTPYTTCPWRPSLPRWARLG